MTSHIHHTAQVDPSTVIGPGAIVGEGAIIGPDCRLDAYAIIGPWTQLGSSNHVHSFAVVGGPAQDRRTQADEPHRLAIGDGNVFREGVTVSRGTLHGGGTTTIGDTNLFMTGSHVAHDCTIGHHNTLANHVSLAGHVEIGDRVTIGGHAAVHQFSRIGDLALVAANAMVSLDVPPYCIAAGDRATLRGLNTTGLKRADLQSELRSELARAFKFLFRGGPGRLERAKELVTHQLSEVRGMATFLLESERGVLSTRME
jgi:UDP-N-acetylglucosamine acyltransferase